MYTGNPAGPAGTVCAPAACLAASACVPSGPACMPAGTVCAPAGCLADYACAPSAAVDCTAPTCAFPNAVPDTKNASRHANAEIGPQGSEERSSQFAERMPTDLFWWALPRNPTRYLRLVMMQLSLRTKFTRAIFIIEGGVWALAGRQYTQRQSHQAYTGCMYATACRAPCAAAVRTRHHSQRDESWNARVRTPPQRRFYSRPVRQHHRT